jgi:hypothetical protein
MSQSLPETFIEQCNWVLKEVRDKYNRLYIGDETILPPQHHKFYRYLMFSYCRSVCRNHLMGNYHKVYQSVLFSM